MGKFYADLRERTDCKIRVGLSHTSTSRSREGGCCLVGVFRGEGEYTMIVVIYVLVGSGCVHQLSSSVVPVLRCGCTVFTGTGSYSRILFEYYRYSYIIMVVGTVQYTYSLDDRERWRFAPSHRFSHCTRDSDCQPQSHIIIR
eukprot:COSAG02_NODE_705_length_18261_cov_45.441716_5_plen_143_part_00